LPAPGSPAPGRSRPRPSPQAGPAAARRPTAQAPAELPREPERASGDDQPIEADGPRDELLAARAAVGEGAAFEALLRRYGARVLACLERLLGDHHRALDASQEVWLKVHRALPAFDATRRFRPWLFAIAMNHARDRLRERPRREETLGEQHSEELRAELPGPGAALLERSAIAAALARIAEPFRTALLLVDVAGNDYPEAAEALGLPVGTVKSRVHRARLCFRAAYAELEAQQAAPQAPMAAPQDPPRQASAPTRRRG
jgi:RNA polymerase sigma-70 factor (ECF subfamily)